MEFKFFTKKKQIDFFYFFLIIVKQFNFLITKI